MGTMRKLLTAVAVGGLMAVTAPGSAEAQTQNGLVNVAIGDVTILENVAVGVAANVAVQVCGLQVGNVGIIARQVARQGQAVVCTIDQGDGEQDVVITR
jgi:flagellar basal body rod protein FlgF